MGGLFASYFGKGGGGGGISPSSSASASAGLTTDTSKVVNFGSKETISAAGLIGAAVVLVLGLVILKKV